MLSDKEILLLHKKDIASDYAEVACFKGNVMSMGKIGEMKVYNKITSRLNKRLDRVALALSINDSKMFGGVLAKYSHGKQI